MFRCYQRLQVEYTKLQNGMLMKEEVENNSFFIQMWKWTNAAMIFEENWL